jgi:sugar (pentulose or hexulose) kinase
MPFFLGVDIGSSSIKAAVLKLEDGTIEHVRSRAFPNPKPSSSGLSFEIDAAEVSRLVRAMIEELLDGRPGCEGIVTCSQMGGLMFVGAKSEILSPYYSWRDQRSVEPHPSGKGSYFDVYASRLNDSDRAAIGQELRVGSTGVLLFWLAENRLLPPTGAIPVALADGVLASLCDAAPTTDPTLALGMLNLHTGDWHRPVYDAAGARASTFSRLQPYTNPLGNFRFGASLIPCYPAVGDQQAALRGIGLREGELSINSSTGSQVSQVTPDLKLGNYQSRPFFGDKFLNTITHLPAGRSLNVLFDLLTELPRAEGVTLRDPWDYIARKAANVPAEELSVDLAFFAGPLGDRGNISNIRTDNLTAGAIFRAAFRNMADNYLACAKRIDPSEGWSEILLSGGLPQKMTVLREMILRRFKAPIRDSQAAEETLSGLLSIAREIARG